MKECQWHYDRRSRRTKERRPPYYFPPIIFDRIFCLDFLVLYFDVSYVFGVKLLKSLLKILYKIGGGIFLGSRYAQNPLKILTKNLY